MIDIAIIGGGAAGLMAAVAAAQNLDKRGGRVTVFESAERVGKSILRTGNGRCNFSNSALEPGNYHNSDFVKKSMDALPPSEVWKLFSELGLLWLEEEGRMYPLTNKASSVLDVLRFACEDAGVIERRDTEIHAVTPSQGRFLVMDDSYTGEFFDAVIIAFGGKVVRALLPPSYPYENTRPTLGALKTNTSPIKGLNNIRVRCTVSGGGQTERGEILFRDYGISGIAVFNLSRFVDEGDTVSIDFLPGLSELELEQELCERYSSFGEQRTGTNLLAGMFVAPLARAILKKVEMKPDTVLNKSQMSRLAQIIKNFELPVLGIEDARQCQIQRGGFAPESFNPVSMESLRDPGLYLVGEALDVDGPCGGYNLHWAWTSGILAGRAAAGCPVAEGAAAEQAEVGHSTTRTTSPKPSSDNQIDDHA